MKPQNRYTDGAAQPTRVFFYAWDDVWSRTDLTLGEKAAYSLIDGFTITEGACRAGNEYIGARLGMSARNVRVLLSSLQRKDFISNSAGRGCNRRVLKSLPLPQNHGISLVEDGNNDD